MSKRLLLVVGLLLWVLIACSAELAPAGTPVIEEATQEPTPMPTATEQPTETPVPSPTPDKATELTPRAAVPVSRQIAAVAIADLSQRLEIPPDEVEVVEIEAVDWPDASLGCPAPGMAYAQVITEGMKVVLAVGDQTYNYHGSNPSNLFLCGPKGPVDAGVEPPASSRKPDAPELDGMAVVRELMADMADRLGTDISQISLTSFQSVEWTSSGLGCEQQGQMYLQVMTPGYKVLLTSGDTTLEYHTDAQGNFVHCATMAR